MIELNLKAETDELKKIKAYLESNASEVLAEKINNGVHIEKDGKRLLSKKDLTTFMAYAEEQVLELIAENERKGRQVRCIDDPIVYGWAIHYFEEDSIEGKLYNEDGTEYKPAPKAKPKTNYTPTYVAPKPQPKPQLNIFDMLSDESAENSDKSSILPHQSKTPAQTEKVITPVISATEPKKGSAMYQHYLSVKQKYNDCILFYRLGDFYEMFGEDAKTSAEVLNLTLTGRDCGLDERIPMVGIPFHAVDNYVNKIVERGYKVVMAEDLDNFLEFKNFDEYEELSEQEMHAFDSYVDEDSDEMPTVSKIVGPTNDNEDDDCTEILNEESAKAFDKETLCIISDLFDGEITLA